MKVEDIPFGVSSYWKRITTLFLDWITIHMNELTDIWDVRRATDKEILEFNFDFDYEHPFYKNVEKFWKESKDRVTESKLAWFTFINSVALANWHNMNMTTKELNEFLSHY